MMNAQMPIAPVGFLPVMGNVRGVQFGVDVHHRKGRTSNAQKAGLRYEKQALTFLRTKFDKLETHLWARFQDDTGIRYCQLDALARVAGNRVVIFETKIRHTALAWWQLRKLYEPVVRAALPSMDVVVVEMTRSYDGQLVFPEEHAPHFSWSSFEKWLLVAQDRELTVWQWRKP